MTNTSNTDEPVGYSDGNGSRPALSNLTNLVLTRFPDQQIMIGDDIQITIIRVRGNQVRLAFRAPRSVQIHRQEVYDDLQLRRSIRPKQP